MASASLDVKLCEGLIDRVLAGDDAARNHLLEVLWPVWLDMVQSSRTMGALRRSEDDVRNVAARLVEKLTRRRGRKLGLFNVWRERHPDKDFGDWLRIVTANAIRDYVREQLGPSRVPKDEVSVKRLLNEFFLFAPTGDEVALLPAVTPAQTARELSEFATRRLPTDQVLSLTLWLEGATFGDIGTALGATEEDGRKTLRAAVATLRRHFASERE